jgi:hypothetical protein
MASISPDLEEQIKQAPQNDYSVIITLKGEQLPSALEHKGKFIMANKIYSATISGKEIESLIGNSEIEAIEADTEMHAL